MANFAVRQEGARGKDDVEPGWNNAIPGPREEGVGEPDGVKPAADAAPAPGATSADLASEAAEATDATREANQRVQFWDYHELASQQTQRMPQKQAAPCPEPAGDLSGFDKVTIDARQDRSQPSTGATSTRAGYVTIPQQSASQPTAPQASVGYASQPTAPQASASYISQPTMPQAPVGQSAQATAAYNPNPQVQTPGYAPYPETQAPGYTPRPNAQGPAANYAGSFREGAGGMHAQQQASAQVQYPPLEVVPERPAAWRSFLGFIILLAAVVGAAWMLRLFAVSPYEIPSGSMESTIMINDRVFSEKISYYMHGIEPGDIVTFDDPEVQGRTLIKRCIAVGGQTVELIDGIVYVDGLPLDEPYTNGLPSEELVPAPGISITYPYLVPDGYIWVMGDNRTNSADSRYFGAVPASSVTGHAFCIYWPFERIRMLE